MTPSEREIERGLWAMAWLAVMALALAGVVYPRLPPRSSLGPVAAEGTGWWAPGLDRLGVPYDVHFAPVRVDPLPPEAPNATPRATRDVHTQHVGARFLAASDVAAPVPVGTQATPTPTPPQPPDPVPLVASVTHRIRVTGLYQDRPESPLRALVEDGAGRTHVLANGDSCGRLRLVSLEAARATFVLPDGTRRVVACGETIEYDEETP